MRQEDLSTGALCKICQSRTSVGSNSGHLIIKAIDERWHDSGVEHLLKFRVEVISDLSEAVETGEANFGVGMCAMLFNNWNHSRNLFRSINVFTHLGESHDTSVLVTPVSVVLDGGSHKLTE